MQTRTIYKTKWTCLRPGQWQSECGWYVIQRAGCGLWVGEDLIGGDPVYASCLTTCIYQLLQRQEASA